MPTTPRGIPYPASTDAPRVWEDMQELADGVDSALGALSAADITSGTFAAARLGSGTANSTTFLRGDGSWQVPAGGALGALATKAADTTRTSTTTRTADPHLSVSLAASAVYLVTFFFEIALASGTTSQTLSMSWVASGASQVGSGVGLRVINTPNGLTTSSLGGHFAATATTTAGTSYQETLHVQTTTATTLAVHWAQSVSSAVGLVLKAGSTFSAVRVA